MGLYEGSTGIGLLEKNSTAGFHLIIELSG